MKALPQVVTGKRPSLWRNIGQRSRIKQRARPRQSTRQPAPAAIEPSPRRRQFGQLDGQYNLLLLPTLRGLTACVPWAVCRVCIPATQTNNKTSSECQPWIHVFIERLSSTVPYQLEPLEPAPINHWSDWRERADNQARACVNNVMKKWTKKANKRKRLCCRGPRRSLANCVA